MKTYEGLFIFPETLDEEGLDQAIARVKEELEGLDGSLESNVRMGKKTFARPMQKQKAGHYVMMMFKIDGANMDAFKSRLKLTSDVFRHQFVESDGAAEVATEA